LLLLLLLLLLCCVLGSSDHCIHLIKGASRSDTFSKAGTPVGLQWHL
jgi:hypothetical protein